MNKALVWILQSLDRELSELKLQLGRCEQGSKSWNQTKASILKLEKMCEGWRKTQQDLNTEQSSETKPVKLARNKSEPKARNQDQLCVIERKRSAPNKWKNSIHRTDGRNLNEE